MKISLIIILLFQLWTKSMLCANTGNVNRVSSGDSNNVTAVIDIYPCKHAISFEFLGMLKSYYNISYDYRYSRWFDARLSACISDEEIKYDSVPKGQNNIGVMVSCLSGGTWSAEFGAGIVYQAVSKEFFNVLSFGVRYQPPTGGLLFKFGLYPALNGEYVFGNTYFFVETGFSLGYSF